jgi:hypothetical protein
MSEMSRDAIVRRLMQGVSGRLFLQTLCLTPIYAFMPPTAAPCGLRPLASQNSWTTIY